MVHAHTLQSKSLQQRIRRIRRAHIVRARNNEVDVFTVIGILDDRRDN